VRARFRIEPVSDICSTRRAGDLTCSFVLMGSHKDHDTPRRLAKVCSSCAAAADLMTEPGSGTRHYQSHIVWNRVDETSRGFSFQRGQNIAAGWLAASCTEASAAQRCARIAVRCFLGRLIRKSFSSVAGEFARRPSNRVWISRCARIRSEPVGHDLRGVQKPAPNAVKSAMPDWLRAGGCFFGRECCVATIASALGACSCDLLGVSVGHALGSCWIVFHFSHAGVQRRDHLLW